MSEASVLIEMMRTRDSIVSEANNEYSNAILNCKMAIVIDKCFYDSERRGYNRSYLVNTRKLIEDLGRLNFISMSSLAEDFCDKSNFIIGRILSCNSLSDIQKYTRIFAFLFLRRYLERETVGVIPKFRLPRDISELGRPSKKPRIIPKIINKFIALAEDVSLRDAMMMKLLFHTGKSQKFILDLECKTLDYKNNSISVINGMVPKDVMNQLRSYIESTKSKRKHCSKVFITNQGKPVYRSQLQNTLATVNEIFEGPERINATMIRRSKEDYV